MQYTSIYPKGPQMLSHFLAAMEAACKFRDPDPLTPEMNSS